jgi:hypothetical protein
MSNVVKKYKLKAVKSDLLKGKTYKQSLLDNGYTENTANMGAENKVIQEALIKINQEIKESDVTVELVLRRLNEDRELARKKKDTATMTRCDELYGKFLAMFTERTEIKGDMTLSPTQEEKIEEYINNRVKDNVN